MRPDAYAALMRQNAKQVKKATQEALSSVAVKGEGLAKARTRELKKVDTGGFVAGWHAEKRGQESAAVANNKGNAPFVDDGRPPGKPPPIDVLVRWVERRLGLGGAEARQAAFAISQKLAQRGVAAAEITSWLAQRLKKPAQQAVADAIEELFEGKS